MILAPSAQLSWFEDTRVRFESVLADKLGQFKGPSDVLNDAVEYALLEGGKRLRAMLVFSAGHAVGTPMQQLTDSACAIEAMHAYSLVHDDLPSMDNDVLRRGKPTCHVKFGEAFALLAGDALQTAAFQWLAQSQQGSVSVRMQQIAALAGASGLQGMAAGQAIDLAHVGKPMDLQALEQMHARKTGDLIRASVRMGYVSNPGLSPVEQEGLEAYAHCLGLAYQVIDDILDVESTSDVLGKTSGKDALNNKPTMVSLMGLEQARQLLEQLRKKALAACEVIEQDRRGPLETLVELITNRKS
ncbi:farnesyl-diphosphate synthase [Limnobacter thiooxidans]|uniref:Polyprenyl synthetase family protein n=1 Tax=Limnobacter thiooxidans TaxID=131080 RepID=A0AA86ME19_9BURK|nr:farnesyl diphosphate synthase [Limnobacter sp.]MCZ8014128.1 polyprenyl synthetase family protein [Limnobacter sp.]RZS38178.1 farnesyl-diphosphate synthase [Limnobacter thiooxidans]BET25375.1 polyprenyl synthetase family protein [Limnobacter thiooxidans]